MASTISITKTFDVNIKDGLPISSQFLRALTRQSVIHIKTKTLDLLHGQTSVDEHSGGDNSTLSVSCFQVRLVGRIAMRSCPFIKDPIQDYSRTELEDGKTLNGSIDKQAHLEVNLMHLRSID